MSEAHKFDPVANLAAVLARVRNNAPIDESTLKAAEAALRRMEIERSAGRTRLLTDEGFL